MFSKRCPSFISPFATILLSSTNFVLLYVEKKNINFINVITVYYGNIFIEILLISLSVNTNQMR
jgi:hypothetical protein